MRVKGRSESIARFGGGYGEGPEEGCLLVEGVLGRGNPGLHGLMVEPALASRWSGFRAFKRRQERQSYDAFGLEVVNSRSGAEGAVG